MKSLENFLRNPVHGQTNEQTKKRKRLQTYFEQNSSYESTISNGSVEGWLDGAYVSSVEGGLL